MSIGQRYRAIICALNSCSQPIGASTMSKIFRKIFCLPNKEKAQPVTAGSGGLGNSDPRSSSQPIIAPYVGDQHTPDPRSSGQSAPDLHSIDQRNIGPYAGGQPIPDSSPGGQGTPDTHSGGRHILEPPSKGQRIREGFLRSLDFISAISEATDLLKPLKATCEAIKVVLQVAKVSIYTSWCRDVVSHSMK